MTVNELIGVLQAMPPDHPVIMRLQSFSSLGWEVDLVYRLKAKHSQKIQCFFISDNDKDSNAVILEAK